MVRRSETLGTRGRVTEAQKAKTASVSMVTVVESNADEFDFPEMAR